ncbi:flagellar motor switch phosphatase FliY [Fusibacter bizertensis]|jgi:flagellar motor switch protein FliN|uniref:Flagellar motor switch phosphatase FliY n=1 Tax=Fusibacter bizertensis TaxID=1488331 RepID=A0ABT6N879_9FIRM|nr:flagellar motor switch phosphatase FliY [Fusibacter bizertensis]MDH8676620.1 flagellar motor switch phosphatase FliY [Fusibacter bizertensis]
MSDMLSQEEIDALLGGGGPSSSASTIEGLTAEEADAIGEIGNISMGTAATTLFTLLNKKVTITTPKVSETTMEELAKEFLDPSVLINITYKVGIEGVNFLILHEKDVKIITDLMMGGDGTNISNELNDLHLSAISEAMNQMIGSSSTSLSEMLGKKIDISPPEAYHDKISELDYSQFGVTKQDQVVKIAFRMTVGDLIDSEIMQVLPLEVAKQMVSTIIGATHDEEPVVSAQPQASKPETQPEENISPKKEPPKNQYYYEEDEPKQRVTGEKVNAVPLQFENFDSNSAQMYYNNDIDLIRDVPLEITVELGKTGKKINEILDFGVGTVIELDRLVGEPLDVLANGKRIAKGEVVVVDENYGIRITDIIIPRRVSE